MPLITNTWKDYECIDVGNGEKLERWGSIILRRPDPQCMWDVNDSKIWTNINGHYHRSDKGGGYWDFKNGKIPEFTINYGDLKFKILPTGFKHTGLFPEQAINWDFMAMKIKNSKKPCKILNLFAYTGGATIACSNAGANEVVHVDASSGMNEWAKENMKLSNLENNKIRFIKDDVLKFVEREIRRGNVYQGIIMDPPSYGRGPDGTMWKIEDNLYDLINKCLLILDKEPIFFIVNCYASSITPILLNNILKETVIKRYPDYSLITEELCLPITKSELLLPCGITGRVYK